MSRSQTKRQEEYQRYYHCYKAQAEFQDPYKLSGIWDFGTFKMRLKKSQYHASPEKNRQQFSLAQTTIKTKKGTQNYRIFSTFSSSQFCIYILYEINIPRVRPGQDFAVFW